MQIAGQCRTALAVAEQSVGSLARLRPEVATGKEAGVLAGVAGRSDLVDLNQNCIPVTVQVNSLDVLSVSRGVPLAPVLTPRPRPEGHPSLSQGAPERLVIHPAHHEHLT